MSSPSVPQTMRAVAQNKTAENFKMNDPPFSGNFHEEMQASVQEVPVPQLEENDILIKVHYAAQNPTDWKHSANMSPALAILGCDLSGEVVKLGEGVVNKDLKIGDKVACTVHGGLFKDKGGYAEYARAQSDLVWKVPESLDMAGAATFACAWVTACQALIQSPGKSFPPDDVGKGQWYLVYGASSSVGLFAIGLAKALNYKVLAVCSEKNFDLVKSYGADATVSYKDGAEKCSADIKRITGGGVEYGLDCISEGDSFKISLGGFKEGGEGQKQLNAVLPVPEEVTKIRPDVKVEQTLMYQLFGIDFNLTPLADKPAMIPGPKSYRDFHVEICKHTPELITKYGVKPNPVTIRGGLEDVTAGWEDMKNKKVSGSKLVYKVAQ